MHTRARTSSAGGRHRLRLVLAALLGVAVGVSTPAGQAAASQDSQPVGGVLLGSDGVVRPEGTDVPPLPKVRAASYVVSDLDTGKVLAAKDAHGSYRPASTIKVLTALATLPYLDPGDKVRPKLSDMSVDGTKVGVDRRRTYTARSLFQAMLMMSANDAAEALARAAGGSGGRAKTLARMNALAEHLRATDTVARNPSGLDAKRQVSSAYDLTLIFRNAMRRADFRKYITQQRARFPALKNGKTFQIASHNRLLSDYPGTLGGKNGFTQKAKASYVGAAERNQHRIGVAIMRTPGEKLWPESKKLLDWGFDARSRAVPVGDLVWPRKTDQPDPSKTPAGARDEHQAVTPVENGGLPPWLMPLALGGAVILCGLLATMAITSRRQQAGGARRRGTSARSRHAHAAAQVRRGHARGTPQRRRADRRPLPEGESTAAYPIWPTGHD